MSDKQKREEEDESAILLDDFDGESNQKQNVQINADDEEMLLLSSPSPPNSPRTNSKGKSMSSEHAGPSGSGIKKYSKLSAVGSDLISSANSNIVIDDSSDSAPESLDDSVEVIGSEDEMEEESESDESASAILDGGVQIFMAQGSFFIWNAEDVHMLREECRIVGKLVGCLPRAPRQNSQLGLPLQLMPEEAKLLEEIEAACVVVESDSIPDDVCKLRKETFESMREDNYIAQQKMYRESRKEEIRENKHKILEGKKAKKRKLKELENVKKKSLLPKQNKNVIESETNTKTNESVGVENVSDSAGLLLSKDVNDDVLKSEVDSNEKSKIGGLEDLRDKETKSGTDDVDNNSEACEEIKDSSQEKKQKRLAVDDEEENKDEENGDDKNDDSDADGEEFDVDGLVTEETHVKHSIIQLFTENPWKETVRRPKHWIYPLSQKEYLRYEVFRDLWKKGYFLTSGSKFGGDFLVYPGDPARYHSHFIAVCIDKTVDLSSLDIVSLGRLGSNVRKSVLLCAFNKTRQIVYTSLQWTGIS